MLPRSRSEYLSHLLEMGLFVKAEFATLMSTRKVVMMRVILAGTESGGITKLTQDTMTNSPEGM